MKGDFKEVTYGYCKCGCGEKTAIIKDSCASRSLVKGEPMKFLQHHHIRRGAGGPSWKGGNVIQKGRWTNYTLIYMPDHPKSSNGYVYKHILVAEKALGRYLPDKVVIHHVDKNGLNNNENNLVICQDSAYHNLLHKKQRRLEDGL